MDDRQLMAKVLAELVIEDKDYWIDSCDDRQSVPMAMLFLREAWNFIRRPGDSKWVDATIAEMESRMGREDLYSLRFLPEKPDLLAAVKAVKDSDVDIAAVTHIIREAQKDVLYGLVSILDGGHCFSDGLDSNWGLYELDEELEPRRPLMMLSDAAHLFDPDQSDG